MRRSVSNERADSNSVLHMKLGNGIIENQVLRIRIFRSSYFPFPPEKK